MLANFLEELEERFQGKSKFSKIKTIELSKPISCTSKQDNNYQPILNNNCYNSEYMYFCYVQHQNQQTVAACFISVHANTCIGN